MHIDKYKIFSMDYTWKNGKQSKSTSVQQMLTSDECIMGKTFIQLLEDLDQAWHQHGRSNHHGRADQAPRLPR